MIYIYDIYIYIRDHPLSPFLFTCVPSQGPSKACQSSSIRSQKPANSTMRRKKNPLHQGWDGPVVLFLLCREPLLIDDLKGVVWLKNWNYQPPRRVNWHLLLVVLLILIIVYHYNLSMSSCFPTMGKTSINSPAAPRCPRAWRPVVASPCTMLGGYRLLPPHKQ